MNTITIIILTIIAWQLIYVIAINLTDDDTVTDIIGGGIWLIPVIIINKIFYK